MTAKAWTVISPVLAGIAIFLWGRAFLATRHILTPLLFTLVCFSLSLIVRFATTTRKRFSADSVGLWILVAFLSAAACATAFQMSAYLALPADLLSFSESPFVDKILRIKLGEPVYSPPEDNSSYPYTPGAELVVYGVSKLAGHETSIPFYRVVQFSFVVLAAIVATLLCGLLARNLLTPDEYQHRSRWFLVWLPILFLVATDPRFNLYTHSLHNDGLALLVSICAFTCLAGYLFRPRTWLLVLMIFLPGLGFMVKQSMLIWLALFSLALLVHSKISRRHLLLFLPGSIAFASAVIGFCYLAWGNDFVHWVFVALGKKQISFSRDLRNLLDAGMYAIMGLVAGWILILGKRNKTGLILWLVWLLFFGSEIYTSGFAWQRNHIGPGVLIACCWFLVAVVRKWPVFTSLESRPVTAVKQAFAISAVLLLLGSLQLVRDPVNPVPPDFFRYVEDIERQFDGNDARSVLMDTGTWIYLKNGVLMKDRSTAVSVHVGLNQPEISYAALRQTIKRIESRQYKKILARELDTGETWYDYQDRGSGVKKAILESYREVARIPAVRGVANWWPTHLLSEIVVLVPNSPADEQRITQGVAGYRYSPPHAPAAHPVTHENGGREPYSGRESGR